MASEDIAAGETMLFVPKELTITLDTAMRSQMGRAMTDLGLSQSLVHPDSSILASYLLLERTKPQSPYAKFFAVLPTTFYRFPVFFNEQEKDKWLKGSPFVEQLNQREADIKFDYELICQQVPEFSQFTLREFSESRMIVSSKLMSGALVPFAHTMTHSTRRYANLSYSDEREGFVLKSAQNNWKGS